MIVNITCSRFYVTGLFVDSEIDLSTRNSNTRVFINKTLSTETAYQQDVINRDRLSTRRYQQRPIINTTLSTETVYTRETIKVDLLRFVTCVALTHTFSTLGLRLLTHRFPTHIIRDSPSLNMSNHHPQTLRYQQLVDNMMVSTRNPATLSIPEMENFPFSPIYI
jgi:hypothetical protein